MIRLSSDVSSSLANMNAYFDFTLGCLLKHSYFQHYKALAWFIWSAKVSDTYLSIVVLILVLRMNLKLISYEFNVVTNYDVWEF